MKKYITELEYLRPGLFIEIDLELLDKEIYDLNFIEDYKNLILIVSETNLYHVIVKDLHNRRLGSFTGNAWLLSMYNVERNFGKAVNFFSDIYLSRLARIASNLGISVR